MFEERLKERLFSNSEVTTEILKKAVAKTNKRIDLVGVDYKKIPGTRFYVISALYNKELGDPTLDDIKNWIKGKPLRVVVASIVNDELVRIFVSELTSVRDAKDKDSLSKVSAGVYLDKDYGTLWRLEKVGGRLVLVRLNNPSEIEKSLKALCEASGNKRIKRKYAVEKVESFSRLGDIMKGDIVIFIDEVGNTVEGVVNRVDYQNKKVTVILDNGDRRIVDFLEICAVYPGEKRVEEVQRRLKNYYKQIYGDDYASKLLTDLSKS